VPASISKTMHPRAHKSTALLWPTPVTSSGARYSGVPHRVYVSVWTNFAKPQSTTLIYLRE